LVIIIYNDNWEVIKKRMGSKMEILADSTSITMAIKLIEEDTGESVADLGLSDREILHMVKEGFLEQ